jgi:hypothetical protein
MKKHFKILLLIFISLSRFYADGQTDTTKKVVSYWVNTGYLKCLDSGIAVCNCMQHNPYLIMYLDTVENVLHIHPAVTFSWEPLEPKIIQASKHKNVYTVIPEWKIDSGAIFRVNGMNAIFKSPSHRYEFKLMTFKIHYYQGNKHGEKFTYTDFEFDSYDDEDNINIRTLLAFSGLLLGDTAKAPFKSMDDLKKKVSAKKVGISVSDDYSYNEMSMKTDTNSYFLLYQNDSLKIYREPHERSRGEEVDYKSLKPVEILYKGK